jgi:8-oxo-dGTP pyrophosphatase MutT (NUDIX family)
MNQIICSGALFYSKSTKRFLLLHRTQGKTKNHWGLVGGTNEDLESPWQGLKREIKEEIGEVTNIKKVVPLESFISKDQHFYFHTYLIVVDNEFIPVLNDEHDGYAWVSFNKWPKPLHQGLQNTLRNKANYNKLDTAIKLIDSFFENENLHLD